MDARPGGRRAWRLLAGAALLALAGLGAYAWLGRQAAAPQYSTVAASRGAVAPAVIASGTVNPETTIQLGTYVSGVIQSIHCDFNTRVKAGQLCARIDPRPYQSAVARDAAALAVARAQLEKDRASLDNAARIDARQQQLLRRGFVAPEAADSAASALRLARAQLALDQASVAEQAAQLEAARINLGYTDIVSPVDGTVVSRNVNQGQTVAASFQTPTLFLVATDLARMQVDANVSEADIGQVAVGNSVSFTVSSYPERQFHGEVRQVRQAPQTVQNVVTYDVVVGVANPDLALKPGMTAALRIVTRQAGQVLRVPSQALRYRPPGQPAPAAHQPQVWVLDGGQVRRVPVEPGLDDERYVEVKGGALREGDAVIVAENAAPARPQTRPGLTPPRR